MPQIHIIIAAPALRDAISEALMMGKFDQVQEHADLSAALKSLDKPGVAPIIILDQGDADKKTLKLLQDDAIAEKIRCIFFLGLSDESWSERLPVESFPKPLRLGHLLARLLFHISTRSRAKTTAMTFGPWRLELQNRQIVHQDSASVIRLTEKETALLDYLVQSEAPVGREELLAAIWGHDGRIDTHTLETHIYQLRRKLDPDGNGLNLLINEQGAYRLKSI